MFQSPAKAVYNARHWNQHEPEEMPVPPVSRSQTAPVRYCILPVDCRLLVKDGQNVASSISFLNLHFEAIIFVF